MNELKSELKRRNLAVSGPRRQLIDRLKPRLESTVLAGQQMKILQQQQEPKHVAPAATFVIMSNSKENSPAPGKCFCLVQFDII